jgi:RNA polymerase sigma factor (sigma-70 family)
MSWKGYVFALLRKGPVPVKKLKAKRGASPDNWSLGDLGAFYSENRQELHSFALRKLKDAGKAEEVLQESFMRMILAAPELYSSEHVRAYLFRSIETICIDIFRREGRRPNLFLVDEFLPDWEFAADTPDHADIVAAADDAALVRQALALLSPAERAALVLWELEGRSSEEIARELGIKEKNVRQTVARARASLREILANRIVDDVRGLTALDLLSSSYKRAKKVAKKSSGVALTIFVSLFFLFGSSLVKNDSVNPGFNSDRQDFSSVASGFDASPLGEINPSTEVVTPSATAKPNSASARNEENTSSGRLFQGLNRSGVPFGFTVSDLSGALGEIYFRERNPLASASGPSSSQIIKTSSEAANIMILQTLTAEGNGVVYQPTISFGRGGEWVPLSVEVSSLELKRESAGNYLLTVRIDVNSEVETPISIKSSAGGRDLYEPPKRVVTRILLDSSKIGVLAQAVFVVETGAEA